MLHTASKPLARIKMEWVERVAYGGSLLRCAYTPGLPTSSTHTGVGLKPHACCEAGAIAAAALSFPLEDTAAAAAATGPLAAGQTPS